MFIYSYNYSQKKMKMSISMLLILLALGAVTGAMAGLFGIGGGIVVIPALVLILGFSQQTAQGTSLAMMLPPIGLIAVFNYYKAGYVDIKIALILAIAFLVGSYFGSKLAINLPQALLKKIFAVFLLLIAVRMLLTK
jgi:uncharacterized protein